MGAVKTDDISDIEVCRAVQQYQSDHGKFPYELLMAKFGCCFKVAYAACERAERHALIDCGVSLRTGWLTDKGFAMIAAPKLS